MTNLALEVRKHRRSRLPWLIAGLLAFQLVWLSGMTMAGASAPTGIRELMTSTLYDYLGFLTLLAGPTVGLVATRIAGVDQEERMGQVFRARGATPWGQFASRLVVLAGISTGIHLFLILTSATLGARSGLRGAPSYDATFWLVVSVTIATSLAVSAVQLALATIIEQPSASVVIGIVGSLVASFLPYLGLPTLGWLLPWGIPVAASPYLPVTPQIAAGADFALTARPGLTAVAGLSAAVMWTVLAALTVKGKENRS